MGLGTFSFLSIAIGLAYVILVFCIAEMSSALPFAGGAWGLARVTLGFYPGFLIGCCETLEYISFTSVNFILLSSAVSDDPSTYPYLWLLFYSLAFIINVIGNRVFWPINLAIAIFTVIVLIIYCLGTLGYVDFSKYAPFDGDPDGDRWFVGGGLKAMKTYPLGAWSFFGIEAVVFACDAVKEPTKVYYFYLQLILHFYCSHLNLQRSFPSEWCLLYLPSSFSQSSSLLSLFLYRRESMSLVHLKPHCPQGLH